MLAYFNKYRNEINFMDENNKGVVCVNDGTVFVKTNNVLHFNFDSLDNSTINIPKGNYIAHIHTQFLNNDICFLDKFNSIDEVLNNPYKINVIINDTTIDSMLLLSTTDPLIVYNTSIPISVNENAKLTISSNYDNMQVIKIHIILEEILGNVITS